MQWKVYVRKVTSLSEKIYSGNGYGELIINGGFNSGANWSTTNGAWTIGSGLASYNGSGWSAIYQNSLIIGKTYRIQFDFTGIGEVQCMPGLNTLSHTFSGSQHVDYIATADGINFAIICYDANVGSIDNVSVIELDNVGTDWIDVTSRVESIPTISQKAEITSGVPVSDKYQCQWKYEYRFIERCEQQ